MDEFFLFFFGFSQQHAATDGLFLSSGCTSEVFSISSQIYGLLKKPQFIAVLRNLQEKQTNKKF